MRWRPYRSVSSSTLRASMAVLRKIDFGGIFADRIAAIEFELTLRELAGIADECGGYLVPTVAGVQ